MANYLDLFYEKSRKYATENFFASIINKVIITKKNVLKRLKARKTG